MQVFKICLIFTLPSLCFYIFANFFFEIVFEIPSLSVLSPTIRGRRLRYYWEVIPGRVLEGEANYMRLAQFTEWRDWLVLFPFMFSETFC